jgi:uracil-DNA glycosylase family 4
LKLCDATITNAVRCVPPENKPNPAEIRTCRTFLEGEIAGRSNLRAIVALGRIAHDSVLRALGEKPGNFPFAHGAVHRCGAVVLYDSYHCSRQNVNTGVLKPAMFEAIFSRVRDDLSRGIRV